MLNINLCSFWLLHLFIGFLRSWKPLNHLYHQHSWWVILKELKCIFICLWYHIMRNFCQLLSPLSFLQFVDNWILMLTTGRRWRWWAGPANGKKTSSFSCTSFWLYCSVLSGMRCCSTSNSIFTKVDQSEPYSSVN